MKMREGNDLNPRSMIMDPHAIKRARQRLKTKSDTLAEKQLRGLLKNASFISKTVCDKGNPGLLYAYQGYCFIVSVDKKVVKTIMKPKPTFCSSLKPQVIQLYQGQMRRLQKKEHSIMQKIHSLEMEYTVELAQLQYRLYKTRSQAVKMACQARINAIHMYIEQYRTASLKPVQDEIRRVSRSLAAIC